MIISFFNLTTEEEQKVKNIFQKETLKFFKDSVNKTNISEYNDSNIICICPKSNLNIEILSQCKNLKYIIARSTGIDHIDTTYCNKNNIIIKNTIKYGGISVAEYQFALLLNLTRKINIAQNSVRKNGFIKTGLQGIDLYNKTIGIIGYGNIGKNVAKLANAFGMKVLVNTKTINTSLEQTDNIKFTTLNELYEKSDIISINIPLTKETTHLINEQAFSKMKDNIIIINTSRGKIIDTNSLINALDNKKIAAAALDVIEGEKYIKNDFLDIEETDKDRIKNNLKKLLSYDNVIITPHNAYNSIEAVERIFEETIDNIKAILTEN